MKITKTSLVSLRGRRYVGRSNPFKKIVVRQAHHPSNHPEQSRGTSSLSLLAMTGLAILSATLFFNPFYFTLPSACADDWPQLQHDPQHSGKSNNAVLPGYEVAWAWVDKNHIVKNFVSASGRSLADGFEPGFRFTTLFGQQVQPIIYAGKAYFGSMNGSLYAVNALGGDNLWDFATGGPILATAAAGNGIIVTGSMDGKVYALNVDTGIKIWEKATGAGINAAPVIHGNTVYIGSRDGIFYALDLASGSQKWSYATRVEPADPDSPFNKAPIVAPAALSEDGATVFFGAENMFFYALNAADGSEKWPPKKVIGQSFLYAWPVVKGDKIIVRTMSSLEGAEWLAESVLDALPDDPGWPQERQAILDWLAQDPHQKTLHVFDVNTGLEPYQVAMGRVSGNNYAPHPPVVDNQDRVLTYWRSKNSTFFSGGSFGTNHCPDFSALDLTTGDRVKLSPGVPTNSFCPELDNGFQPTIGGNFLYLANSFRGTHAVNMSSGQHTRISSPIAHWDWGDFRGWGFNIIYFGNDSQPPSTSIDPRPSRIYQETIGFSGVAIALVNGVNMLFVNEPDSGAIVAIRHKP